MNAHSSGYFVCAQHLLCISGSALVSKYCHRSSLATEALVPEHSRLNVALLI